jgi:hypothetical protein
MSIELAYMLAAAEAKIKDYETNGVPGVVHVVDAAFHRLAVAERNHAWAESENRLNRINALEARCTALGVERDGWIEGWKKLDKELAALKKGYNGIH